MKGFRSVAILAIALFVMAIGAFAASTPDGATLTQGASTAISVSNTVNNITAQGGNYTELNASYLMVTDNWQIVYGQLFFNISFADGSNVAYDWGQQNPSGGYIFFTNSTGIDWSALAAGTSTQEGNEDTALSLGSAADNVDNTFGSDTNTITIGSNTVSNADAVTTKNNAGTDTWKTAITYEGSDIAYCGFVSNDGTSFDGKTVDYQAMIPTSNGGTRLYYVYLALE
jgi:hypothetical protein